MSMSVSYDTPHTGALRYEAYMEPATGTRPSIGLVQPTALAFVPAARAATGTAY